MKSGVGEPGIGDPGLPFQGRDSALLRHVSTGSDLFVEQPVDQGVDAADEKGGHRGHAVDWQAPRQSLLQRRDVGVGHALVGVREKRSVMLMLMPVVNISSMTGELPPCRGS